MDRKHYTKLRVPTSFIQFRINDKFTELLYINKRRDISIYYVPLLRAFNVDIYFKHIQTFDVKHG